MDKTHDKNHNADRPWGKGARKKSNSRMARDFTSAKQHAEKEHSRATLGSVNNAEQRGAAAAAASQGKRLQAMLSDWIARPLFDYSLLLIVVGLLTGIGLVMVLSASMVSAGADTGNVWSVFTRQVFMVLVGAVAMWAALSVQVETIRKLANLGMLISVVLLVMVLIPGLGVGQEEFGAQSWLSLGGFSMQPSELAKICFAVWGSKLLADKVRVATSAKELFLGYSLMAALLLVLVIAQGDLGMTASIAFVVIALAWFAGLPRVIVSIMAIGGLVGMIVFTAIAGFRSARIRVFLNSLIGNFTDVQGDAYQSYQGFLSLADGSVTGVGIGQSSAKWFYLPEAKNDFIFAIIGEEMGFIGALIVILLYAILGWLGLRIAARQADPFLRLLAATLTLAVVVQAFINIGYVVGVLPVTGLQLPLISAGGTSALVTLFSMGLLATCARHESEAVSAMQTSGRPGIDRLLRIPEPMPYDEKRRNEPQQRSHRDPQRFGPPVSARTRRDPRLSGDSSERATDLRRSRMQRSSDARIDEREAHPRSSSARERRSTRNSTSTSTRSDDARKQDFSSRRVYRFGGDGGDSRPFRRNR